MLIKVKRKHIKEGKQSNVHSCPIALAMGEMNLKNPKVFGTYARAGFFGNSRTGTLSRKVKEFIKRFDEGLVVKPFAFRFNLNETE